MAKKEFKFDEESDDFSLGDETLATEEPAPEAPAKKKGLSLKLPAFQKPSRKTMLLLLLLVVIAAGGAAFLVLTTPEPPPPPPPPVKKKVVVKQEVAPAAPPAAAQPSAPDTAAKTAPKAAVPAAVTPTAAAAPAKAVATAPPAPAATPPAAPAAAAPAAPAAKAETKPAAPPVAKVDAKGTPAPEKAAAPAVAPPKEKVAAPAPVASDLPFAVKGNLYADRDALAAARRKLHRLGYETYVKTVRAPTAMTRLRIGYFSDDEAFKKSAELSKQHRGIFTLRDGARVALYAGSYADIDKAREHADELYKAGIAVTEEAVEVVIPRKQLYVGGFSSRQEAERAAQKVRAAGLDAEVVKR